MPEPQLAPSFGRYRDPVLLGSGGMGAVYRATDPSLGRHVAIKVLMQRDPRYVQRFRREAQVLARIAHPAIIQIYEIVGGEDDTADPYIVMEYFEGRPLDAVVKQGPLAPAEAMSIVRQCAEGLRKAHASNVIHRDIKPANIMLSAAGKVKILDFGIAKLFDAKTDLTGQTVLGTPYYMSPEQATGYAIDARSDLYSWGITAFHLLTGRKPFEAKSKVDVMLMQVKAPLPEIQKLARCDEGVARIVEKMCAKKPADRYRDCGELIAALDALPHPNAQPPGARSNGKPLATPSAPERASARGPGRRMWIGVAAGAAAAVALLVSLGLALVGGGGGAPTGRVPTAGWVPGAGLRKVQARGGYGNCVFSPAAVARGVEDASSLRAIFTGGEPIHGRCFFARSLGSGRRGELWQELWVDGVKRGQVSYDGVLPPGEDQLAISVSGPHAARIRELSAGKHTLDIWIYRQPDGTDHRIPLAAGELVVRK